MLDNFSTELFELVRIHFTPKTEVLITSPVSLPYTRCTTLKFNDPLHHKLGITSHYIISNMHSHLITTYFIAVFSVFCPRCEQLCDEIRRRGYYMIKKVPTASDNILRTSLDQGIPLVTCSCSEYELPGEVAELLRTPIMPDSWNILYLYQNGDGNHLQCNERIKMIHIEDSGSPVVEVLNWLSTKLPRRSATSVDGQQQGSLSKTERIDFQ